LEIVEPLLPPEAPKPKGGRPRIPARAVFGGIIFVLRSGIPWRMLPQELGCGSGMTCWRRLRDWQTAGVWERIHRKVLNRLHDVGRIDWSRASLDSASIPAKGGGNDTGPNPTDQGRRGTKRHLLIDRNGIPLAALLTAANVHDSKVFEAILEAIPPIQRRRLGRPRCRPEKLHADKAYDIARCRKYLRKRGIACRIARKGVESSERLGRFRWVVERTLAWIGRFRRLAIRYERRSDIHMALLALAFHCAFAGRECTASARDTASGRIGGAELQACCVPLQAQQGPRKQGEPQTNF
jgi:transposase